MVKAAKSNNNIHNKRPVTVHLWKHARIR